MNQIVCADCREYLKTLPDNCIDSCVTDPPYGLVSKDKRDPRRTSPSKKQRKKIGGFMGLKWDGSGIAFQIETWKAVLRVLKPGAHLLAFGGTRTSHRMVCAIEDAGFEIRDSILWIYSTGFPKSRDIGKAIDAEAGVERKPPATKAAKQWDGWGTGLKPACEIVCLARKPISEKTVAANVLKWGTGALNIDGCVVVTSDNLNGGAYVKNGKRSKLPGDATIGVSEGMFQPGKVTGKEYEQPQGRWPANVLLDEVAGKMLDKQSGMSVSKQKEVTSIPGKIYNAGKGLSTHTGVYGVNDSGGASRFFYCSKPSKRERNVGCVWLEGKSLDGRIPLKKNFHATVKPYVLIRYLINLITQPGGIVLDPFVGSGTTCMVAAYEGYKYLACDLLPEYVEIAKARVAGLMKGKKK